MFRAFALIGAPADGQQAKVLQVFLNIEWYGCCEILNPAIDKAPDQSDLDDKPILPVHLDLTNATKRHPADLLASEIVLD